MAAVGIDLGTTNSCVAVWRKGRVVVIEDAEGMPVTPSVVGVRSTGEVLVGRPARAEAEINPEHTYRSVKRLIGRAFDDPHVATAAQMASFAIAAADNGEAWIQGRERLHSPAEISAHVLRRLKEAAEKRLGEPIKKAVVTVPAYFNAAQRQATKDAGEIAGLEVMRIINEPTAAALAYGLETGGEKRTVAVFDLGGGTFDLSVLRLDGDDFEVIATNGDTFLGGEDFDQRIVDHVAEAFLLEHGIDPRLDKLMLQRLKDSCEQAKRDLSSADSCELRGSGNPEPGLRFFTVHPETKAPIDLRFTLTRAALEGLVADLIDRCVDICRLALQDAALTPAEIDQLILVGGMTRMPAVSAAASALFGAAAVIHPNPDQVVAEGAALMAASLTGSLDIDLQDVTPFAIGLETADRRMYELVPAQTRIPTRIVKPATTAEPDQPAVTVRVRQGNEDAAGANLPLGQFHLSGLRPGPAGSARVDIMIDIDADGIVTVGARDRATGRNNNMTVEPAGLAPKAIQRMAKAARMSGRAA